jgi:hypothetical protein
VDVDTSVDVVEQVPSKVIGIIVDHKVIATIPTPIGAQRPIRGGNFEVEAPGEPEAVMIAVDAKDVVPIAWPNVGEVTVFPRTINVITAVLRSGMAVPMVIVDVRGVVDLTVGPVLLLAAQLLATAVALRSRRDMPLVGSRFARMTAMFLDLLRSDRVVIRNNGTT